MKTNYNFGSIIIWAIPPKELSGFNKLFDILQNFFTKMPQTHSSILLHKIASTEKYYEFEASTTVRINIYEQNKNSEIYDIHAPYSVKFSAFEKLYYKHYGKIYNILQTFYFIWRYLLELLGFKATKMYNPFGIFGLICSELVYLYLYEIANQMNWVEVKEFMNNWNADNFHAGDVKMVMEFMVNRNYASRVF